MLPRLIATLSLASLVVLSLMLTFTSPATAGPFGLLMIFATAYLSFVGMISFFLFGINRLILMLTKGVKARKLPGRMEFRRAYYFGSVLAFAPVILIGFQSIGSVTIYSILLIVLLEVLGCLYVSKRWL